MIAKCKELLVKYREIIIYLVVGVLTTIVSWGACYLCKLTPLNSDISWQNDIINTIGWISGVMFSYPLSRKWVFKSTNPKVFREFFGFALSRLSTWIIDIVIMRITVNAMHINYWIAKIFISAVIVTILNYVFSKLIVFKKKKQSTSEKSEK